MIKLQFTRGKGPVAWAIRWFTWSSYNHVDFVLSDGSLLGAKASGGVRVREPLAGKKVTYTVDAPESVLYAAQSQIGKSYDFMAIVGFLFRRRWHRPNRWFCSEFVAWAFEQGGYPLLRSEGLYRLTPRDLMMSPILRSKDAPTCRKA